MAQDDELFIEGWDSKGKSLERITTPALLHDLLKETNASRNDVDNTLALEMDELQKKQNELNHVNEQFLKMTGQLEQMKRKQKFDLDMSRKSELSDVMRGTLDNYVERRPTDSNDKRSVDVHFLTGEQVGTELNCGREGAGSRNATFIVALTQTVQSLATQAAKYWGLDPEKVFFLDRDGRIVQGKMNLSDIILPPLDPADDETPGGAAAGGQAAIAAGGATSSALAIPGAAKKGAADDQIQAFTVKGRNYRLTLVRAKTVLTKEDLSQPKGEKWNDFTFDQKRLNEDLETTRKRRGDPAPADMKVSMDTIPSLYDLIKQGNLRKFQKNADKWCRIIELVIFLIMWGLFIILMKPESTWTLNANFAAKAIRQNIQTFTLAERAALGIHNFSQIVERSQFEAWVKGPLRRASLPGGLDRRNSFPLKVQGRVHHALHKDLDMHWCGDDHDSANANDTNSSTTNSTNGTLLDADGGICYDKKFKNCPNKGVVEFLDYAERLRQSVPECKAMYSQDAVVGNFAAMYSADAFSYINGEVSSYLGGNPFDFNLTGAKEWTASMNPFLDSLTADTPAKLVNVLTFVPTLQAMFLSQFLAEFTTGGPVITSTSDDVIDLNTSNQWEVIVFIICITLAIIIFLMELRRITGWPRQLFFEDRKEPCGPCTMIFLLVPILLALSFVIVFLRQGLDVDIMKLSDQTLIEQAENPTSNLLPSVIASSQPYEWTESEKVMFQLQVLVWYGKSKMMVNLLNFTLMMFLSYRFFLVYFPEMRFLTLMIQRATKPVMVALVMLLVSLGGFSIIFYLMFSDELLEFRNGLSTLMAVLQFAHGGFVKWRDVWHEHFWSYSFLILAAFVVFTLNLNNLLIAILVSHKKEAELHRHYSSHPFWQNLHREHMQSGNQKELNPALAGFDFGSPTYKDGPKKVTEAPGWQP